MIIKILNKIIDSLLSEKIRRCLYCRKIRLCKYIDYRVIKDGEHNSGIKGNFCNECGKRTYKDIFTKLKNKQYYVFKMMNVGWVDIRK